ncbi:MAG: hypothetical protein U0796_16105 [Gemmatales bacterium]
MHWARYSLLLVSLLYPALASAQPQRDVPLDKQVQITDVRVGFPAAGFDLYKEGKWVPVVVTVGPHKDLPNLQQSFTGIIQVETKDSDGWNTRILKDNVVVTREANRGVFQSYIKVSDSTSHNGILVRLRGKYGATEINQTFAYPPIERSRGTNRAAIEQDQLFVVNIGNSHGIRAAEDTATVNDESNSYSSRNNPRLMSIIGASPNQLFELPDRWYGYESVDAVVIATGGNFGNSLAQKLARDAVRRDALEQWVLQGGHLVVSVADNANVVGSSADFPLEPLLPVKIDRGGAEKASRLDGLRDFIVQGVPQSMRKAKGDIRSPIMTRSRLDTKPGVFAMTASLVSDASNFKRPLIVRSAYGLGKITVIGFDTNTEAFQNWEHKADFWSAVFEARTITPQVNQYYGQQRDDASLAMANKIEEFGDVPVISFAVVALFIALYILLIGPVDYFVLKKVFKRLEYTWITFPTVVLLVSLAAYFGAYYIKGDKLRINKVDLIEVDQSRERAMGTTWLAIFSPRLQNYNVELEPQGVISGAPTISWLGRFSSYSGARMVGQSQGGLFERDYDYTANADGLRQLPIQVWSQKSLEARWLGNLDKNKLPIDSKLVKERLYIKGSLKSRLPGKLLGAKLFYSDKVWNLGDLEPDKDVNLEFISQGSSGVMTATILERRLTVAATSSQQPDFSSDISSLIFQSRSNEGNTKGSDYLRYLNQSWRLKDYGEAVLVGTLVDDYGDAVKLNQGGSLGTRLKLTNPAGDNLITGTMRHAAYLRVFIPVKEGTASPQ